MNKIIYNYICNNFLNYKTGHGPTSHCVSYQLQYFSESEKCVRALSTHKMSCMWGAPYPILKPAGEPEGSGLPHMQDIYYSCAWTLRLDNSSIARPSSCDQSMNAGCVRAVLSGSGYYSSLTHQPAAATCSNQQSAAEAVKWAVSLLSIFDPGNTGSWSQTITTQLLLVTGIFMLTGVTRQHAGAPQTFVVRPTQ